MTRFTFPGQEHLPPPVVVVQPSGATAVPKPAPPVQPAPHPVARRATALKAAIDGGWDNTIEETLLAAEAFDTFLTGKKPGDNHGN